MPAAPGNDANTDKLPQSGVLPRSAEGAYETLSEFFRLCDAGGEICAFSEGNPARRYARLAERLLRARAAARRGRHGPGHLQRAGRVHPRRALRPGLLARAGDRPPGTLGPDQPAGGRGQPPGPAGPARRGLPAGGVPNFIEGFPGVACSETHNPSSVGAWSQAARAQDRQFPYFGRPWTWRSSICEPWPGWDNDHYDGPWNRTTANPVLVEGTLFDPATRYEGAVTLDRLLPRSRLLTLAGWGHTSLFASACVDAHVSTYLLTSRPPARGTVCQPDVVPFAEPAATAQRATGAPSKAALIPPILRRTLMD